VPEAREEAARLFDLAVGAMMFAITFSSAAANGASLGGGVMVAFFSTSFSMSISNLVACRSAPADSLTR
jgi:hypothetical protein